MVEEGLMVAGLSWAFTEIPNDDEVGEGEADYFKSEMAESSAWGGEFYLFSDGLVESSSNISLGPEECRK